MPGQRSLAAWDALLVRVRATRAIAVVGGGAAGVEVLLAMQYHIVGVVRIATAADNRSPEGAQRIPGEYPGMVQYRRSRIAGGTFFFTVNLHDRRRTLLVEHADALRNIVRDVLSESPFVIDAMVVRPDHWHAVWTLPPDDAAYARRIQRIKARFTLHRVHSGDNLVKDSRGGYRLWQKRFWEHTNRNDRDFEAHVNYVHINPVKHGHVARAIDWPHSTPHRYVKNAVLTADWACASPEGMFGE